MIKVHEICCPICLESVALPRTAPYGDDPRCARCQIVLVRYLPCTRCGQAYHPALPACPGCGIAAPPEAAGQGPLWQIADRVVLDALAALQAPLPRPAEPPPAPPAAEPPAPKARPANGNGRAPGAKAVAALDAELPSVLPRSDAPAAAEMPDGAPLPPGLQPAAIATTPDDGETMPALFSTGSDVEVGAASTIAADYEFIQDHARLAEVIGELSGVRVVAVDTETTGLDPFADDTLLLVQVATPERAYLVDARRVDPRPLRRILEDEKVLKLLQNAKFDYKMLRQQLGIRMRTMYDTMLAERVLTAGISREIGLAALAKKYLGFTMDKSIRGSFVGSNGQFNEDQLRYAARDALALFSIYEQQRVALAKEKLLNTAKLEFQTLVAVGEMELAGCLIDQQKWRGIIDQSKLARDRAAEELGTMFTEAGAVPQLTLFGGPAINLNSNAQLVETFRNMGIELPDTMEATLSKYDHPAIKKLIEYRGFEKTISAFGEKFLELIHPKTGRIHPDFNQLGADTGRFSCGNPNVQQIPATSDFRSCFIAPPGYKLITCDYSQCELRVLAQLSEDPAFIDAFCSGGDLHQLTASQMYQVPPDQVTKQMRSAAKVINFGLAYGRGPGALGVQLGVSTEEAKKLIDQYFKAYASIGRWLDKAAKDAVRKGYSVTMLGRKRYYPPLDPNDLEYNKKRASIERQGKNSPIQGANADMTKLALIGLNEALHDYEAHVVNTVHDEIVVEAREDQAEVVCKIVEREMVKAGETVVKLVPIVADAKIGDYWSK